MAGYNDDVEDVYENEVKLPVHPKESEKDQSTSGYVDLKTVAKKSSKTFVLYRNSIHVFTFQELKILLIHYNILH